MADHSDSTSGDLAKALATEKEATKFIRAYLEPDMTRAYWRTVGGTLILEYPLVRAKRGEREARRVDGLIIHDGPTQEARLADGYQSLAGRRVTVVQTKSHRLGMYLLGQARYSADLARDLGAEVVATVAVCEANDSALAPFALRDGITVWTTSAARAKGSVEHSQ